MNGSSETSLFTCSVLPGVFDVNLARSAELLFRGRNRRRQRRGILVPARPVLPNRTRPKSQMIPVNVILAARILVNLLIRLSRDPGSRVRERPRVKLRVFDQRF